MVALVVFVAFFFFVLVLLLVFLLLFVFGIALVFVPSRLLGIGVALGLLGLLLHLHHLVARWKVRAVAPSHFADDGLLGELGVFFQITLGELRGGEGFVELGNPFHVGKGQPELGVDGDVRADGGELGREATKALVVVHHHVHQVVEQQREHAFRGPLVFHFSRIEFLRGDELFEASVLGANEHAHVIVGDENVFAIVEALGEALF